MINKRTISLNILFSIIQIIVTGITYYFLYKFLLQKIGADLMGIWAIVLSVSSTANIANLGIGGSVIRYTAKFKENNEFQNINKLLHTALLFIGPIFLGICIIVYLITPLWLNAVITNNYYNAAIELIPYSLLCLMLNALSGIFISCIDGMQKNFIRSLIYIVSFVILILASYLLVPEYGLIGMVYAQLVQAFFLLAGSIFCLKIIFKPLQLFPWIWDKAIFKSIFSFGIQEQIISICVLFFDPFTKSILGRFGDLGMVTYYEMANRMVIQLRGLMVSANQVFIPVYTSLHEKSTEVKQKLYKQVFSISFLVSILWVSFIIASIIPVSIIWIGSLNSEFIIITIMLTLAYWCNILISPAYFSNIGSATLKDNVVGNVIIAVFNMLLCIILGYYFKGYGVVIGWSLALALGSMYIMYNYHRKNTLKAAQLLIKSDWAIVVLCSFYCLFSMLFFYFNSDLNVWLMFGTDIFMFLLICVAVYLIHPLPKTLLYGIRGNGKGGIQP